MHILVVNGPNMNMLGIRQPEIYGHETYEDLKALIRAEADRLGASVSFFQSNHEGAIVDKIQEAYGMVDEDVPCEDVLSQINAAKSALHKCGQVVLEGHIQHCVRDGIQHGDADKTIESFTKAVERFSNMG